MGAAEYLFIAWAALSIYRLGTAWYLLEMHKAYLCFPLMHAIAMAAILLTNNYLIGLTISAFTNIIFHWWAKPKYLQN